MATQPDHAAVGTQRAHTERSTLRRAPQRLPESVEAAAPGRPMITVPAHPYHNTPLKTGRHKACPYAAGTRRGDACHRPLLQPGRTQNAVHCVVRPYDARSRRTLQSAPPSVTTTDGPPFPRRWRILDVSRWSSPSGGWAGSMLVVMTVGSRAL